MGTRVQNRGDSADRQEIALEQDLFIPSAERTESLLKFWGYQVPESQDQYAQSTLMYPNLENSVVESWLPTFMGHQAA